MNCVKQYVRGGEVYWWGSGQWTEVDWGNEAVRGGEVSSWGYSKWIELDWGKQ
jgi:hypothetical protein